MKAYVLASQDARLVKVYRRDDAGAWRTEPDRYRDGDRFDLPGLISTLGVAELYDGILDPGGRSLLS